MAAERPVFGFKKTKQNKKKQSRQFDSRLQSQCTVEIQGGGFSVASVTRFFECHICLKKKRKEKNIPYPPA